MNFMWSHQNLKRIDWRILPVILALMGVSLLVVSATTAEEGVEGFLTALTKSQLRWFGLGWVVYFFFAGIDYRKFRDWTWIIYLATLLALIGLFFVPAIQNVHRWYRIPFLGFAFQPSEYAKLAVVIALSAFLERRMNTTHRFGTIALATMYRAGSLFADPQTARFRDSPCPLSDRPCDVLLWRHPQKSRPRHDPFGCARLDVRRLDVFGNPLS